MSSKYKKTILQIFAIFGFFFLWQIAFGLFIKSNIIPSPTDILYSFKDVLLSGELIKHSIQSLRRVLVGFFLAVSVAVPLALLLGNIKKIGDSLRPIIEMFRPIPPIAWIPVAILLFGLGDLSSYFIVFIGAFFPIFTNTYFGVVSMPKIYKNISKTFEITRLIYYRKILLKFALPHIFAGLKIGIGMAWMSVIAAELIGAQSGLGYFIQISRLLLQTEKIFVGMISIGVLGYMLNISIVILERKLIKWT